MFCPGLTLSRDGWEKSLATEGRTALGTSLLLVGLADAGRDKPGQMWESIPPGLRKAKWILTSPLLTLNATPRDPSLTPCAHVSLLVHAAEASRAKEQLSH